MQPEPAKIYDLGADFARLAAMMAVNRGSRRNPHRPEFTKAGPGRSGLRFKGSSAAKAGARMAAKREKANRRGVGREKLLATRFNTSRAGVRRAVNGGRP